MNIATHLPFLHDFASAIHHLDDRGRAFARGYGNATASAQAFAPLGTATASTWPRARLPPRATSRRDPATAASTARDRGQQRRTLGACG